MRHKLNMQPEAKNTPAAKTIPNASPSPLLREEGRGEGAELRQFKPLSTKLNPVADKVTTPSAIYQRARFALHRRRAGKIACLPSAVRQQINVMLRDGLPYATIIARLGEAGKTLNKDNLSRWRKADHQDWLAEQNYIEATTGLQPAAPETKDLALLLADLGQCPTTITRHPDRFPRHLNFLLRLLDSNLTAIQRNAAKNTQIQPGFYSIPPDIAGLHPFADKVTHPGRFGPAGCDNPHLTTSCFVRLPEKLFAGSEDLQTSRTDSAVRMTPSM